MHVKRIAAQLRTTDLQSSIRFYTETLGFEVDFQYEDFYVGIRAGDQILHLKLDDERDASIAVVDAGDHFHLYFDTDDVSAYADRAKRGGAEIVRDVHETPWGTREFVVRDDQGHTLYFGERL